MLAEFIEKSGFKKTFIAAYADISPTKLSRLIGGEASPTIDEARKIAEVISRGLGRSVDVDEIWPPAPSDKPIPQLVN